MVDRRRHCPLPGLIITAIGTFVRVATVFELGHRFSIFVALQPDHRLKTDGFYRFVRHPSYLGALLAMVGWALVFRSIIGLLLTAAMCVPIIARIALFYLLQLSSFLMKPAAKAKGKRKNVPFDPIFFAATVPAMVTDGTGSADSTICCVEPTSIRVIPTQVEKPNATRTVSAWVVRAHCAHSLNFRARSHGS